MTRKVRLELTEVQLLLLAEALDSHVYWQLSDPGYRCDATVIEPGSDDPEAAEEIHVAMEVHRRIEAAIGTSLDAPIGPWAGSRGSRARASGASIAAAPACATPNDAHLPACCCQGSHEGGCCPGWGHFGDVRHIERCDDCVVFADDATARAAHAEVCGCGWGDCRRCGLHGEDCTCADGPYDDCDDANSEAELAAKGRALRLAGQG